MPATRAKALIYIPESVLAGFENPLPRTKVRGWHSLPDSRHGGFHPHIVEFSPPRQGFTPPLTERSRHRQFFTEHRFWLKNGITWFWIRSATALVWVP